jgi:hypothetical protein
MIGIDQVIIWMLSRAALTDDASVREEPLMNFELLPRCAISIAGSLLAILANSPGEAYDVRADAQARAQYSNFVTDSDQSFDANFSASAGTGPVEDGFGGTGQASASASLSSASVSATVTANNGVGNASAEFTEDLLFSVPAGTALADVEFRIPVSVDLNGDYLSTVFGVGASSVYRVQLNAAGATGAVASDNVFQTSCGAGIECDAPPGELWIQVQVADQDLVNLNAIAIISEAGSFGGAGGTSITLGPARIMTSSGATWTSQSGVFNSAPPVPLLGPIAAILLGGLLAGVAYTRLRASRV